MSRIDAAVTPGQPLVLDELDLHGARQAQALDEELLGEFGEAILDGRVEIAHGFQDGQGDDAVHHGARILPPHCGTREGTRALQQPMPATTPPAPVDEKRASFEREALVHLDSLYRVAQRLTGNAADADDLVQETMLKAYRSWDQYTKGTNAKGWLLTILRNSFINEYRRRTRHPESVDIDAIEPFAVFQDVQEEDPQGAFFDRIVDDEVLKAIDDLPETFRETVVLSDVEGMSYQEIARILKVPVGTVKSRLFRARQMLQRKLYEYAVSMGYIKGSKP